MSNMTQLILDVGGVELALPESRKSNYDAHKEPLMENVEMISGRMTRETRGKVWVVSHQYGYLNETDMVRFIEACEKGLERSIFCSFLVQGETELRTSLFFVTEYTRPKFMWSRTATEDGTEKTVPVWGGYAVKLREVKPSD